MSEPAGVVDVAARAGVSLGTVSNVLNRPERVSPKTRARVLRAIEELGFVRNEAARQLRAGRSRTVGLVVLDVRNPFFTDVAAGVEQTAGASGSSVVLCNSNDDVARERHYLSMLKEQRAFGILITPVGEETAGAIEEIRERGTPVVLVDRGTSRNQCSVSVNDRLGGELAVAHLVAQGHTRIAFVGGPVSIDQVRQRLLGARSAIAAAGLRKDALTVIETPRLDVDAGRASGPRLAAMSARKRPTAAFCANDLLALGLLQDTVRRQLSVPGDLAIVGYDDIDFAAAAAVPLTSVRQPRFQLGRAAMELLLEEATDRETHQHRQVVFEPDLVVRESTTG
ncbi:MAG TPA: LacI family DNA-binding transcriptional regulator [Mycobacteriales bacterium]|jgi:LacI family transcriptional regulator|nr:LacI family DNA-binding transcriptional regulator [Mycobacteriales bacterium]